MSQEIEIVTPTAVEAQERASIDMQIATARKYRRDLKEVKARMLTMATLDQETAAACFYTLKRKEADGTKKKIQGPSVRLAEIAVCAYQNIRAASRLIGNDGKKIKAQGVCMDLENNVAVSMETERRITTREGKTYGDDMQIVAANAASAIAFRNAVFKVVPLALVKPIFEQCKLVAVGDAKSVTDRWHKAVEAFSKMGVSQDQLLDYIDRKTVEQVTAEDLADLIGAFNAIRDGEATIEETFSDGGSSEAQQKVLQEKLAAARHAEKGDIKPDERKQPEAAKIDEEHQLQLLQLAESLGVKQDALKQVVEQRGFKALHTITVDKYPAIVQDVKDLAAHKDEPAEDRTPDPEQKTEPEKSSKPAEPSKTNAERPTFGSRPGRK